MSVLANAAEMEALRPTETIDFKRVLVFMWI